MDRQGKPVAQFKERIRSLIEDLSAANDVLGIPAPALAETLVRSGPNRAQYMKILSDTWKFQLLPFDARAAIDTADLIAAIKTSKEKWDTWAKVKFDIQIVAIAKAEGASIIYSDDRDVENYAKRFGIQVIRLCDLPLPPPVVPTEIQTGPIGTQAQLFDLTPRLLQPAVEAASEQSDAPKEVQNDPKPEPAKDAPGPSPEASDKHETNPAHPVPVRGSDEGRAQGKTAREGSAKIQSP
jgi:predicted nuclease of predicted toxin-antitoxin system